MRNDSKNDFEVKIIKEGSLIHHHIMHPKDQLTVEDVGWYGTKFLAKNLGCNCDENIETPNISVKKLEDGWEEVFFDKKYLQDFHPNGGLLMIKNPKCSEIKKA